jgi:hypothetical protein
MAFSESGIFPIHLIRSYRNNFNAEFKILTASTMKSTVFWDVAPLGHL